LTFNVLDKQCPKCSGLGRTENPTWLQFSFRTLETKIKKPILKRWPLINQLNPCSLFAGSVMAEEEYLQMKGNGL